MTPDLTPDFDSRAYPHSGFPTPNVHEADTNRALIASGQRIVIVADHSNGASPASARSPASTKPTSVTDDVDEDVRQLLSAAVGELIVVAASP